VNFSDTVMDTDAVRPTSPVTTDYGDRLRSAARGLGGRAVETEFAQPAVNVEATSPPVGARHRPTMSPASVSLTPSSAPASVASASFAPR